MVLNFYQLENLSSFNFDVKNVKDPRDDYKIPAGNTTNRHDAWLGDAGRPVQLWATLKEGQPPTKVLEMWDSDWKLMYRVLTANGTTYEGHYAVNSNKDFKIVVTDDFQLQFVCYKGSFMPGQDPAQPKLTWRKPEIPEPPLTPTLLQLAASKLNDFSVALCNGGKYAKQPTPKGPLYWIADPAATSVWCKNEWAVGILPGWPTSLRNLIGAGAINTVSDEPTYRKIQAIFAEHLLPEAVMQRNLPEIADKVNSYTDIWATLFEVKFHPEIRYLVFDVLFNITLRMNLSFDEVRKCADLAKAWGGGVVPDIDASPKTKQLYESGMAARAQQAELYLQKLKDPNLPTGLAAAMRDAFGVDSQSTINACFAVTFGGLETSASVLANMVRLLAANPGSLQKIKAEADAVLAKHATLTTPAAQTELKYTHAVLQETMRMTYAVGAVPRAATLPITTPAKAAELPGKCPFMLAWKAMSAIDPTVAGSKQEFKPERWLTPEGQANWKTYQHPFGAGMRECPGRRIMKALAVLLAIQLASKYKFTADGNTEFTDAGIPLNGLPGKIEKL